MKNGKGSPRFSNQGHSKSKKIVIRKAEELPRAVLLLFEFLFLN